MKVFGNNDFWECCRRREKREVPFSHAKSVKSVDHIAIPTPKYNRAGVTLPRFTSQIFTTAARGCNFNNLRKAAAGRVVTSSEFYSGQFCCGPTI
jgi:hypothetical protein